jgi:hypothetical protein
VTLSRRVVAAFRRRRRSPSQDVSSGRPAFLRKRDPTALWRTACPLRLPCSGRLIVFFIAFEHAGFTCWPFVGAL